MNPEDEPELVLLTAVYPPSSSGSAGERVPDTLQVGGGRRKERREGVLQGIKERVDRREEGTGPVISENSVGSLQRPLKTVLGPQDPRERDKTEMTLQERTHSLS